jgi:hypothetical protein
MLEICTSGSVGVPGGQPPWDDPAGGRMTGSYRGIVATVSTSPPTPRRWEDDWKLQGPTFASHPAAGRVSAGPGIDSLQRR